MARCLLIESKLPKCLWELCNQSISLYKKIGVLIEILEKLSYEMFTSPKPSISYMHTFGTICFAYIQK